MKYRLKPYIIDACKFDGSSSSAEAIIDWANGAQLWVDIPSDPLAKMSLKMTTPDGVCTCQPGDFIVRGVLPGEFVIEKPTVFLTKYEEVK